MIDTYTRAIILNTLIDDNRANAVNTAKIMPRTNVINVSGIEY